MKKYIKPVSEALLNELTSVLCASYDEVDYTEILIFDDDEILQ